MKKYLLTILMLLCCACSAWATTTTTTILAETVGVVNGVEVDAATDAPTSTGLAVIWNIKTIFGDDLVINPRQLKGGCFEMLFTTLGSSTAKINWYTSRTAAGNDWAEYMPENPVTGIPTALNYPMPQTAGTYRFQKCIPSVLGVWRFKAVVESNITGDTWSFEMIPETRNQ